MAATNTLVIVRGEVKEYNEDLAKVAAAGKQILYLKDGDSMSLHGDPAALASLDTIILVTGDIDKDTSNVLVASLADATATGNGKVIHITPRSDISTLREAMVALFPAPFAELQALREEVKEMKERLQEKVKDVEEMEELLERRRLYGDY